MLYFRMILRNTKRSARDYLIYFVTMTLCVALFYGFLSVTSRYYDPDLGVEYDLEFMSDGMKLAICLVSLLLFFLIWYVNRYMIRRRQKEFALQTIMGMERGVTAALFFTETLIMGLLSVVCGILLGMLGSQFITAMLLHSYGRPFQLTWTLFPDTVALTLLFFLLAYLIMGAWNTRMIRKIPVIDMLNAGRKNEEDFRKSRWMPLLTLLYGILMCWMTATGISKAYFYWDPRYALPVHLMFGFNILFPGAALLYGVLWLTMPGKRVGKKKRGRSFRVLIAGWLFLSLASACAATVVSPVSMDFYLPTGAGTLNQYMMFLIADIIYFICALIYLANDGICMIKERFPKIRYRGENLFLFGQIISKLRTTTKTVTLICITLTLSICLFLSVPFLAGWADGYLEQRSVYDIQISTQYNDTYEESGLPDDDYDFVTAYLEEQKIKIKGDCTFSLYLPVRDEFDQRVKYDFPVAVIALSDYNHLLTMRGYEPITLNDDEFTTQWQSIAAEETKKEFLAGHRELATDGGRLKLSEEGIHDFALGETLYNTYTDLVYVFPDSICENLLAVNRNRYITTEETVPLEKALELEQIFSEIYPETEQGTHYYIRTSSQQINSTTAMTFILRAAMTYGAVVLLVICFTILALQQLSDLPDWKYRFGVLRDLGVEDSHISRIILMQLGVWFGIPVLISGAVSAVVMGYFFRMYRAQISAYIGKAELAVQTGAIALILLGLLLCYFVSTWQMCLAGSTGKNWRRE